MNLIDDVTGRLVASAEALDGAGIAAPSLLPGWSRGHVLTHLARNADALRNLLIWARTGVETPSYRSQAARDEDIGAGAGRPAPAQAADLARSASAFRAEASRVPALAWQTEVWTLDGVRFPAARLLPRRLAEVELHHTDLGCGYTRADWPAAFATMDLPEPMNSLRATR